MIKKTLLDDIETRLNKIDGTGSYTYKLLEPVRRYRHDPDRDVHEFMRQTKSPGVAMIEGLESAAAGLEVQVWAHSAPIIILFSFVGQPAGSNELTLAEGDLLRALFTDPTTGDPDSEFGVGANATWTARYFDPEDGTPEDGIVLELTVNYTTAFGDPTNTGGQ